MFDTKQPWHVALLNLCSSLSAKVCGSFRRSLHLNVNLTAGFQVLFRPSARHPKPLTMATKLTTLEPFFPFFLASVHVPKLRCFKCKNALDATKLSFWGNGCFLGCLTCSLMLCCILRLQTTTTKLLTCIMLFLPFNRFLLPSCLFGSLQLSHSISRLFGANYAMHSLAKCVYVILCLPLRMTIPATAPPIGTSLMFSASSSSSLSSKMPSNPCNHFGVRPWMECKP